MRPHRQRILAGTLFLALTVSLSPSLYARPNQIDSSERLNLLNQATGNESTSNSFQARMDAIFDTTATPERSYVAGEDAAAREQQRLAALPPKEMVTTRISASTQPKYNPLKNKDQGKVPNGSSPAAVKEDSSEVAYLKDRSDIQSEFDDRIAKKPAPATALKSAASASDSDPLANNPFYTKDKTADGDENSYDKLKPLLLNRLVSHISVISPDTLADYVNQASSKEDLILILMREAGLNYGEASESVD